MRPLLADFASDKKVWDIADEFMFGRSILAAPIVNPQYTEEKVIRTNAMTGWDRQSVSDGSAVGIADFSTTKIATKYLPKGTVWYDFWTGKQFKGGQNVTFETAFDRVPMFVRAGSIVPLGPEMQYVGEKSWDNLDLRIYPGADGQFVLYEDEGDNYNYAKGAYRIINIKWNERARTLTIGARQGTFNGMLQKRRFTILTPDGKQQTINYDGKEQVISL